MFDSSKVPADLASAIDRAARVVALDWPEMVTEEDIKQQVWVKLLDDEWTLHEVSKLNGKTLNDAARLLASRAVAELRRDYDRFTGNYYYDADEVREILARGALVSGKERTWVERQDIDAAMKKLQDDYHISMKLWSGKRKAKGIPQPINYADIIWKAYVTEEYNSNGSDKGLYLTRAIRALTREMNRAHRRQYNPERFRQKPSTTVRIRNKFDPSVDYTRELTEAEWNKTASEYAKDLAIYNESRPYGGPGSRTIKVGSREWVDAEKVSDVTEEGSRFVEPEFEEEDD